MFKTKLKLDKISNVNKSNVIPGNLPSSVFLAILSLAVIDNKGEKKVINK